MRRKDIRKVENNCNNNTEACMIQFGTGGWRAVIGDGFTRHNISLTVNMICGVGQLMLTK